MTRTPKCLWTKPEILSNALMTDCLLSLIAILFSLPSSATYISLCSEDGFYPSGPRATLPSFHSLLMCLFTWFILDLADPSRGSLPL